MKRSPKQHFSARPWIGLQTKWLGRMQPRTVLHMNRLNQNESPIFVILCVLCFQRQSFLTFIFLLMLFQMSGWLSMSVVRTIVVLFMVFLCSTFRSSFSPLLCFIHYENMPIQIYWKFYHQIMKIFRLKNSDMFHISAQNIDCGYSLEPPRRGGSNEYPQYIFLSRNEKNNVYPCKPQFYYIKSGVKGGKNYIGMLSWCTVVLTTCVSLW